MREKLRIQRETCFYCQIRETHGETVRLDRYAIGQFLQRKSEISPS